MSYLFWGRRVNGDCLQALSPRRLARQGAAIGQWQPAINGQLGEDAFGAEIRPLGADVLATSTFLGPGISEQYSSTPQQLIAQNNGYAQHCLDGLLHIVSCKEVQREELLSCPDLHADELLLIHGDIPPGSKIVSKVGIRCYRFCS